VGDGESTRPPGRIDMASWCRARVVEQRASVGTSEWSRTRSPSGQLPWGGQLVSKQSLPVPRSVADGSGCRREHPSSQLLRHRQAVSRRSERATSVRRHRRVVSDEVSERPAAVGRAAGVGTVSQRRGLRRTGVGDGESTRPPGRRDIASWCRARVQEQRGCVGTSEWSRTRSPSGQLPWGGQLVSEQSPSAEVCGGREWVTERVPVLTAPQAPSGGVEEM
jgi:hypothetical protein